MRAIQRFFPVASSRRGTLSSRDATRRLFFQPLEPRCLLAAVGDWAYIDLDAYFSGSSSTVQDLSGVTFYNGQLAVSANVKPAGDEVRGQLVLVDYDLEANTASVANDFLVPSLGGSTTVNAISANDEYVFMTGSSVSPASTGFGEAYRATYDGTNLATIGLGFLPGKSGLVDPIPQSEGFAINGNGVVAGLTDAGHAVFEYDQQIVYAGDVEAGFGVIVGISDDRVKVGVTSNGRVWEADNVTRRAVTDPFGRGTSLLAISPDHSRLLGSVNTLSNGIATPKLAWWTYDGRSGSGAGFER